MSAARDDGRVVGTGWADFDELIAPAVVGQPFQGRPAARARWSLAGQTRQRSDPGAGPAPKRKAGKQPGAKGVWRCEALTPERTQNHYPDRCTTCGSALELWFAQKAHGGHHVLDLARLASGIRVSCVLHRYHAITCPCGTETVARPGTGEVSTIEGRKRQLRPSEAGLVGPGLTTFIAALSVRFRLSRAKIAELLATWFDVRLSVGSIDRCIREAGLACEPMVEGLLADLRAAGVVNADETPWPQRGKPRCSDSQWCLGRCFIGRPEPRFREVVLTR